MWLWCNFTSSYFDVIIWFCWTLYCSCLQWCNWWQTPKWSAAEHLSSIEMLFILCSWIEIRVKIPVIGSEIIAAFDLHAVHFWVTLSVGKTSQPHKVLFVFVVPLPSPPPQFYGFAFMQYTCYAHISSELVCHLWNCTGFSDVIHRENGRSWRT